MTSHRDHSDESRGEVILGVPVPDPIRIIPILCLLKATDRVHSALVINEKTET